MPDSHRYIWVGQCLTGSVSILCGWLGDARLVGVGFHTFAYKRLIRVTSYSIRVMLAHVRSKQAAFIKQPNGCNDSAELQALYALFLAPSIETSTPKAAASSTGASNPSSVSSKMPTMSSKVATMRLSKRALTTQLPCISMCRSAELSCLASC